MTRRCNRWFSATPTTLRARAAPLNDIGATSLTVGMHQAKRRHRDQKST
jgi:hypothetical protein